MHDVESLPPQPRLLHMLSRSPVCRGADCHCRAWVPMDAAAHLPADWQLVTVREAWVEASIGEDWIAAYRLVPKNGVPVIGELRVFPAEPHRPGPGRWSGEWLGVGASASSGGLTARLLRRVPTTPHVRLVADLLRKWREEMGGDRALRRLWGDAPSLPDDARPQPHPTPTGTARATGKRGRKGRPKEEVARIAAAYSSAIAIGSRRPVRDVVQKLRLDSSQVRDVIYRARKLGFLTRTTSGIPAGILTPAGEGLLPRGRTTAGIIKTLVPRSVRSSPGGGRSSTRGRVSARRRRLE
jgi:hypothetical protein